jgi:hypothetical protein
LSGVINIFIFQARSLGLPATTHGVPDPVTQKRPPRKRKATAAAQVTDEGGLSDDGEEAPPAHATATEGILKILARTDDDSDDGHKHKKHKGNTAKALEKMSSDNATSLEKATSKLATASNDTMVAFMTMFNAQEKAAADATQKRLDADLAEKTANRLQSVNLEQAKIEAFSATLIAWRQMFSEIRTDVTMDADTKKTAFQSLGPCPSLPK